MNGVQRDTFLQIASDKKAAGLIYDALSEIHTSVKDQPVICHGKFVHKRHVKVAGLVILAFLLGAGVLTYPTVMRLISLI